MRKMRLFNDSNFLDLARVVIAATIHVPERAQEMVARLASQEDGFKQWIRDAQADGKFKAADPEFASHQIYGLLKTFAFWPQITLGQPPGRPDADTRHRIGAGSVPFRLRNRQIADTKGKSPSKP